MNVTLHGGPNDGVVVREPEGRRLLFSMMPCRAATYYADDAPIKFTGFIQVAYEEVAYRNNLNGLTHTRWEYIPDQNPEVRAAVEEWMARKAEEQREEERWQALAARHRRCEAPRLAGVKVAGMSWLNELRGSFFGVPDEAEADWKRRKQGESMIALLDAVIAAKRRACEPLSESERLQKIQQPASWLDCCRGSYDRFNSPDEPIIR